MTAFEGNTFKGETLFGTFYPTGYIVAVFHDYTDAAQASTTLQQAGFAEVRTWTGREVQDRHAAFVAQRSLLQRVESVFAADEKLALDDYLEAAQTGHFFLTAHVADQTKVNPVGTILVDHAAHLVHYYGKIGMIDLAP